MIQFKYNINFKQNQINFFLFDLIHFYDFCIFLIYYLNLNLLTKSIIVFYLRDFWFDNLQMFSWILNNPNHKDMVKMMCPRWF